MTVIVKLKEKSIVLEENNGKPAKCDPRQIRLEGRSFVVPVGSESHLDQS